MTLAYVKVLVNLKLGLVFTAFFKIPQKVPATQEGNQFIKTKDAHFLLCDADGFIHNMSGNCMKNLGLPPTILPKGRSY